MKVKGPTEMKIQRDSELIPVPLNVVHYMVLLQIQLASFCFEGFKVEKGKKKGNSEGIGVGCS